MNLIRVSLGERSYDIHITSGDVAALGPFARTRCRGSLAFVVADTSTHQHARSVAAALVGAGFRVSLAVLPPGEEQKCLNSAARLYDQLVEARADRKTVVVAVGGGV